MRLRLVVGFVATAATMLTPVTQFGCTRHRASGRTIRQTSGGQTYFVMKSVEPL